MKCSQKKCENDAEYTYVHPGQEARSYACALHMLMARSIANAACYALGDVRLCTIDEHLRVE